ncbi:MAG: YbjQ family protein [Candidatus Thermoplasmatota archaeon]|jgi:uncharacterized protein YbjQ (UPF0145 family)|nr:YbjQ family protein [Candidatus Thermoplasmatota archaeon]
MISLLFFIIPVISGTIIEKRHLEDLSRREEAIKSKVFFHNRKRPIMMDPKRAGIVYGSVTIGADAFKTWLAQWRQLVGGRMGSLLPILERARREATLRALEQAYSQGFTEVGNIRITSMNLGAYNPKKKTLMTSVLVYATAYSDK